MGAINYNIADAKQLYQNHAKLITELLNRTNILESTIEQDAENIANYNKTNHDLFVSMQTEINKLKTSCSMLSSDMSGVTKAAIDKINNTVNDLSQRTDRLKDTDIATLRKDLDGIKKAFTEASVVKNTISVIGTNVEALQTDNESLKTTMNEVRGDISTLTDNLDFVNNKFSEITTSISSMEESINKIQQETINQLKQDLLDVIKKSLPTFTPDLPEADSDSDLETRDVTLAMDYPFDIPQNDPECDAIEVNGMYLTTTSKDNQQICSISNSYGGIAIDKENSYDRWVIERNDDQHLNFHFNTEANPPLTINKRGISTNRLRIGDFSVNNITNTFASGNINNHTIPTTKAIFDFVHANMLKGGFDTSLKPTPSGSINKSSTDDNITSTLHEIHPANMKVPQKPSPRAGFGKHGIPNLPLTDFNVSGGANGGANGNANGHSSARVGFGPNYHANGHKYDHNRRSSINTTTSTELAALNLEGLNDLNASTSMLTPTNNGSSSARIHGHITHQPTAATLHHGSKLIPPIGLGMPTTHINASPSSPKCDVSTIAVNGKHSLLVSNDSCSISLKDANSLYTLSASSVDGLAVNDMFKLANDDGILCYISSANLPPKSKLSDLKGLFVAYSKNVKAIASNDEHPNTLYAPEVYIPSGTNSVILGVVKKVINGNFYTKNNRIYSLAEHRKDTPNNSDDEDEESEASNSTFKHTDNANYYFLVVYIKGIVRVKTKEEKIGCGHIFVPTKDGLVKRLNNDANGEKLNKFCHNNFIPRIKSIKRLDDNAMLGILV